ncbi:peptidase inhibitor family I36 protein [Streptomyces sp. NPDC052095]|uniref:peptidase inhibitor family I36 protein n=1 Tax=unclassified Streptomyces TaxID=2593676 RepID=UPI00344FBB19
MNRIVRALMTAGAIGATAVSTSVFSAAVAQAGEAVSVPICNLDYSVCAYTEPQFEGQYVHIATPKTNLEPPIKSAVNRTNYTWCFYENPGYKGRSFALERGEENVSFPYPVHSTRPTGTGGC